CSAHLFYDFPTVVALPGWFLLLFRLCFAFARRRATSALFPYTTLFRSRCPPPRCAPASPPGSEIAPRMPVSLPFRRCALAWMAASALAVPPCGLARQPPPSPEAVELDRLVVRTATRSERLLSDVPIRTEVLRGEDIALRAATDFSRVAELVNGLRVE